MTREIVWRAACAVLLAQLLAPAAPTARAADLGPGQRPAPGTAAPAPAQIATVTVTAWATTPPTLPPTAATTASGPTASAAAAPTAAPLPVDRPILVLQGSHVDPSAPGPGAEFGVRLDVRNQGRVDAENVALTVTSAVFRAIGKGATLYKEEIDAGETRPFDLRMRVDSAAAAGVHELAITLRWEDAAGFPYSDATSIGIAVAVSDATRPQLVVQGARLPSQVAPGAAFDIALSVRNGGGKEARDVVVTMPSGPLAPRGAAAPVSIGPGATADISLTAVAANTAEPGAVTQVLELRYSDDRGEQYVDTFPVGLVISGQGALGPLPIVSHYSFGEELQPGQVFDLALDIQNVGARDALRTRVVVGGSVVVPESGASMATDGTFAPLDTGNVRYLGTLAAGAVQTLTQRMVVSGSAKAGVHSLDLAFVFTDAEGRELTASSSVSLLVSRPVRLLINAIGVVTSTVVGQPQAFSVEIVNAGDATVNVGNVVVDGGRRIDVTDGTVFVGPLDAGGFFPVDATIVGSTSGKTRIVVTVAYVDDFGRERSVEQPFPIEVLDAPEAPPVAETRSQGQTSLPMRVLKGLLGLGASGGSGATAPAGASGETGTIAPGGASNGASERPSMVIEAQPAAPRSRPDQ